MLLFQRFSNFVKENSKEKVVKKKRARKPMTPEQKAKAVANLKRGRETAMRNLESQTSRCCKAKLLRSQSL
jgi:hypothetical protein